MTTNNLKDVSKKDRRILSEHSDIAYDSPDVIKVDPKLKEKEEKEVAGNVSLYLDKYKSIIDVTKKVITVIDNKCSGYTYKFDPVERPDLESAIRKVFGVTTSEITYEMYKQVIEEQIKSNSEIGDEIFTQ